MRCFKIITYAVNILITKRKKSKEVEICVIVNAASLFDLS